MRKIKVISILVSCLLLQTLISKSQTIKVVDDYSPPCKRIQVSTDNHQAKVLKDFISKSLKNNYFMNDKGIIKLVIFKTEDSLIGWRLIPQIDDSYRDNPPTEFAEFAGDIILVYHVSGSVGALKWNQSKEAYNNCLADVIGDRVYIRPTRKDRWSSELLISSTGNKTRLGQRRTPGRNGEMVVVFNKDKTFEIISYSD